MGDFCVNCKRCIIALVFLLGCCQSFGQNVNRPLRSDWIGWAENWPFSSSSSSSFGTSSRNSSKSRKDRDRHYDYAAAKRAQEEAERIAEEAARKAEEARREEEFVADKDNLQSSLRGTDYSRSSQDFSTGLRGLSDNVQKDGENSGFANGLRGLSENSTLKAENQEFRTDLRGIGGSSSSVSKGGKMNYISSFEYAQLVALAQTEPIRYYGGNTSFSSLSNAGAPKESILESVERKIDIWRDEGKHRLLTYWGDKLTGLARKTITTSSALGTQVVKVYDIMNDIADVKNVEMNVINRTLDASKKSILTGDRRHVEEVLPINRSEVDNHLGSYMEKKGFIPPSARALDKKGQQVAKQVAEESVKRIPDLWLEKRNQ